MGRTKHDPNKPILIKKYANRRLYDTSRSQYITLDDLCEMIRDKLDFVVQDAKTGEDLTQSVLTQVIVEKEGNGENLLPTSFLKQLIGYYGDQMNTMMLPDYLQNVMDVFVQNQSQFRQQFKEFNAQMTEQMNSMQKMPMASSMTPFYEEMQKQQQIMLEQTLKFWSSFADKK